MSNQIVLYLAIATSILYVCEVYINILNMHIKQEKPSRDNVKRLIYFRGHPDQDNSAMITQVFKNYETISTFGSDLECATRTLMHLYNLHSVRGNVVCGKLDIDTVMIGPLHYYGYLNPYDNHTIKIEDGQPIYSTYPK